VLRRLSLTVVLVLLFSSGTALAGSGFYLGFHGGTSGIDVGLGEGNIRLESKDFAWKGLAGVGLGRFIAVETGYVRFGTATDSVAGVDIEQKLWGWDTAGLLKINIGPIDVYGRVGGLYWKAETSISSTNLSTKSDGFDVNYGGGLGVVLGQLEIRAEYVWYDASDIGDPWMASAGLTIGF